MANSDNQINIGDTWKSMDTMQINIGDTWKDVSEAYINIGDTWKQFWTSASGITPGDRGIMAGGYQGAFWDIIEYITISTDTTVDSPSSSTQILSLDNGMAASATSEELLDVGAVAEASATPTEDTYQGMPHFLRDNSKITMDHEGAFHKGFLRYTKEFFFFLKLEGIHKAQKQIGQFPYLN